MLDEIASCFHSLLNQETESIGVLHMTANENLMSKAASHLVASPLCSRYYSDTYDGVNQSAKQQYYSIGNAIYRGLPAVYDFEYRARECSNKLFDAAYSDFSPLSGMHAVICIVSSLTKPGDVVLTFSPKSAGHHATSHLLNALGRRSVQIPWDNENMTVDLSALSDVVQINKPSMLLMDLGRPLFPLPLQEMRRLIGPKTFMVYDASHVLGLIAGKQFQRPLIEGCDVLIGNTHKTFPGPQKGILLFADAKLGQKTCLSLFETVVSSQHTHHAMALYITLFEMAAHAKIYATQIINNARTFASELMRHGFKVLSRRGEPPHSHVVAISGGFPKGHLDACKRLHQCNISTNTQNIFGADCVRTGVQELTRRGMKEKEMAYIAELFKKIILEEDLHAIHSVCEFNSNYQKVCFTLDDVLLPLLTMRGR